MKLNNWIKAFIITTLIFLGFVLLIYVFTYNGGLGIAIVVGIVFGWCVYAIKSILDISR